MHYMISFIGLKVQTIYIGVKLSDEVIESLKNRYKPINKFLLKDNQLTTYTYM